MNFKALMGERKRLVAAREKAQKRVTEIETAMADVYAAILDTDRTDPA
jgi:vacuolar-type H+-ATPase subunit H